MYTSLDLNDFQTPIPASAYFATRPECVDTDVIPWTKKPDCKAEPITEDVYRAVLKIPGELRNHNPAWKSCSRITLHSLGVPDPPIALPTAGNNQDLMPNSGPVKTLQQPDFPFPASQIDSASPAASSLAHQIGN
jgi:hypothetical protein